MEERRRELELLKELRKPIEDMELDGNYPFFLKNGSVTI